MRILLNRFDYAHIRDCAIYILLYLYESASSRSLDIVLQVRITATSFIREL